MSYKLVRATHPDGGSSTMTEARARALDLPYTEKGAVTRYGRPVPGSPAPAEEPTATNAAPQYNASMKRDELDEAAARLGLDGSTYPNKDELAAALNDAAAGSEEATR